MHWYKIINQISNSDVNRLFFPLKEALLKCILKTKLIQYRTDFSSDFWLEICVPILPMV